MFKEAYNEDARLFNRKIFKRGRQTIEIGVLPYEYGYKVVIAYYHMVTYTSNRFSVEIDCKADYDKIATVYGCCLYLLEEELEDLISDYNTSIKDAILVLPNITEAEGTAYKRLLTRGANNVENIDIDDLIEHRRTVLTHYGRRY